MFQLLLQAKTKNAVFGIFMKTRRYVYLLAVFFCFALIAGAALPVFKRAGEPPASNAAEQASVGIGGNDYGEVAESAANKVQNVTANHTFSTVADTNLHGPSSYSGEARYRGPDNTSQGEALYYTDWKNATSGVRECSIVLKVDFGGDLKIAMQKGYVKSMSITVEYLIQSWGDQWQRDIGFYSSSPGGGGTNGEYKHDRKTHFTSAYIAGWIKNPLTFEPTAVQITTMATAGFWIKVYAWTWSNGSGVRDSAATLESVKIDTTYKQTSPTSITYNAAPGGTVTSPGKHDFYTGSTNRRSNPRRSTNPGG